MKTHPQVNLKELSNKSRIKHYLAFTFLSGLRQKKKSMRQKDKAYKFKKQGFLDVSLNSKVDPGSVQN